MKNLMRQIGVTLGGTTAGPAGALLGGLASAGLECFFPAGGMVQQTVSDFSIDAVRNLGQRMQPGRPEQINADLQRAFHAALVQALYDLGGRPCFPQPWQAGRDVPEELPLFHRPQAAHRLQQHDPSAQQACELLHTLVAQAEQQQLLPAHLSPDLEAAYRQAQTLDDLARLFFDHGLLPVFAQPAWADLRREWPDLEQHLRRYLFGQVLVHLNEFLKRDTESWRAFTRLLLEGTRAALAELAHGQADLSRQMPALLARLEQVRDDTPALERLSSALADGLHDLSTQFSAHLDRRLDALADLFAAHLQALEVALRDIRQDTTQIIAEMAGLRALLAGQLDPATQAAYRQQELALAHRLLATLPLDRLPDHAPLPTGSRMPLSRNPLFVGRADDLQKLAAALKGGETVAIGQIAAATRLGGIGKTNLATELVHRYGQFFAGGVFWLSFADPGSLPAEIAECGGAGALNLPGITGLELPDQVRRVLQEWQSPLPRLLVFDNCEDEALLAQWRPPTGGCRVLVTSRRATWDTALGVQALPLGVLPRAESIALLRKFVADLSDADADAIADELGDLPLALHLAGSFLARYWRRVTPTDYLARLRQPDLLTHRSLVGRHLNHSPTAHDLHVGRSFALSYDRLDPADPIDAPARALLARAAHFAPGEPLPRELLLQTVIAADNEADEDALLDADDALHRLLELGLLEQEAPTAPIAAPQSPLPNRQSPVRLHRLLAAFVLESAQDAAQTAVEQTMRNIASDLNTKGIPAPLPALQPHLRHVTDVAQQRADEPAARLCNELGFHLHMIGDYAGAQWYMVYGARPGGV